MDGLKVVLASWEREHRGDQFGVELSWPYVTHDIQAMVDGPDSDVVTLFVDDKPKGFLAMFYTQSFLGGQFVAVGKYFFVCPEYRSQSKRLVCAAERCAKHRSCTHLVLTASNLAGARYERSWQFYNHIGFELFESSFIKEL